MPVLPEGPPADGVAIVRGSLAVTERFREGDIVMFEIQLDGAYRNAHQLSRSGHHLLRDVAVEFNDQLPNTMSLTEWAELVKRSEEGTAGGGVTGGRARGGSGFSSVDGRDSSVYEGEVGSAASDAGTEGLRRDSGERRNSVLNESMIADSDRGGDTASVIGSVAGSVASGGATGGTGGRPLLGPEGPLPSKFFYPQKARKGYLNSHPGVGPIILAKKVRKVESAAQLQTLLAEAYPSGGVEASKPVEKEESRSRKNSAKSDGGSSSCSTKPTAGTSAKNQTAVVDQGGKNEANKTSNPGCTVVSNGGSSKGPSSAVGGVDNNVNKGGGADVSTPSSVNTNTSKDSKDASTPNISTTAAASTATPGHNEKAGASKEGTTSKEKDGVTSKDGAGTTSKDHSKNSKENSTSSSTTSAVGGGSYSCNKVKLFPWKEFHDS